jgi:pheromone shutdown-related protein TraB
VVCERGSTTDRRPPATRTDLPDRGARASLTTFVADIETIASGDRTFVLVGTAHISRESVDLVREVIAGEQPDRVCVELDEKRLAALRQPDLFASLDLKHVIRTQQLAALFVNLILASYQKRLGGNIGVMPGAELLEAVRTAEAHCIPVSLCDRDVRVTLRRAWDSLPWWRRFYVLSALLVSLFERPEVDEESLREMRQSDVMSQLIEEMGRQFPSIKRVLIDERDAYLAEKVRAADGQRIVAVIGAGHRAGIAKKLLDGARVDLAALETVEPVSPAWKWAGWSVPASIVALIAYIGIAKGPEVAGESVAFWIAATGFPSFLGALAAFSHPLTAVTAFVAAPITTLTPLIGVGYVTAFLQAYLRPPLVREFHAVGEDIASLPKWWTNRLLRILLVFFFTSLGGTLGTFVGGAEIVSKLW